jgi:hypothetical protein
MQKESTARRTLNIAMDDGLFFNARREFVGHICKQGFAYGQEKDPLGYVDDDGLIRDMQMVPLGSVNEAGDVFDLDRNRIGFVNDGMVYNAQRQLIGYVEVSPYSAPLCAEVAAFFLLQLVGS